MFSRDFWQQQWSFCPSLFQFQLSLAQPPKKLGHGRGSGESDLCDASISGDDREESGKFALHCPLDWEAQYLRRCRYSTEKSLFLPACEDPEA